VTWPPSPAHIPMLEVPFGQNVSPEPRPAAANEAVEAFLAYGEPAGRLDESVLTEADLQALLTAVAAALNACERARVAVKLAHGAVLTNVGYVLPVYPEAGERFAVRTMALTEFSAQAGSDDED
jgi:hypothetical protein